MKTIRLFLTVAILSSSVLNASAYTKEDYHNYIRNHIIAAGFSCGSILGGNLSEDGRGFDLTCSELENERGETKQYYMLIDGTSVIIKFIDGDEVIVTVTEGS
jgi:hypothetical protein